MSNERIGLLVAAVAALVLAFVVLSPDRDDEPGSVTTPTPTAPGTTVGEPATTTATTPSQPPAPQFTRIRVQNGDAVGGVKPINVKRGERARILVSSQDTSDDVHVHGYDISRDLKAGGSVRLSFVADAEGIFEIELEEAHTQIARLVVEP